MLIYSSLERNYSIHEMLLNIETLSFFEAHFTPETNQMSEALHIHVFVKQNSNIMQTFNTTQLCQEHKIKHIRSEDIYWKKWNYKIYSDCDIFTFHEQKCVALLSMILTTIEASTCKTVYLRFTFTSDKCHVTILFRNMWTV